MNRHSDDLDDEVDFILKCFRHEDDDIEHLPVPVYSYIKPTMGPQFILHILLSMGHSSAKIYLTHHATLRECLRSAKLIGDLDDEYSLQEYSNNLLQKFIETLTHLHRLYVDPPSHKI